MNNLTQAEYKLVPIGEVSKKNSNEFLHIFPQYHLGLENIEKFSHILVFWWPHKKDNTADRKLLQATPPRHPGAPITGIFTTRSPARPNPIALTIVELLEYKEKEGLLRIDRIDAEDGTPIIDIKPYLPSSDCILNVKLPSWFNTNLEPRKGI